ncbi:hypothetical protein DIPPA_21318 [Diplonema papillatum]|nr:hypothetical protein DIPPA_21318 [Diplonema papillatum]
MQKQGDTIREMKAATDDEEKKRMAAEAKIQKARNEVMKLKEGISGQLKREKDWLTNELILQKGAEATAAQQLREWKREAKTLAMMIVEVDDRIAEQEVPIAAFLTEEKRKTKQRGGPLLLDDEDVLLCRERRRSRGGKTPSDKKLMQRLATDHDRLLLEYQFLCADLADCAAGTDELLDNLKQSLSSYIEGERAKSGSQHAVSESLHELLLVLHDLTKSRRRALERLDKTEAFAGDELLAIEDQLKGLEAYARDPPPEARNMPKRELRALLEERTEAVRVGMYEKTIQLEGIERVRRELSKASRAAASQKEKVNERLRDLEGAAEASERKVKELVCDVSEIIGVADTKHEPAAGHPSRTFLGKALVGLHQDTRAIVVKRCSGRLPLTPVAETCANSKKPPSAKAKNLLTGKPSTTSTRRCGASKAQTRTKMLPSDPATPSVATSASAAVAEYDTLVASLKQHFGVPAKSTKTSLESEWKSLW